MGGTIKKDKRPKSRNIVYNYIQTKTTQNSINKEQQFT